VIQQMIIEIDKIHQSILSLSNLMGADTNATLNNLNDDVTNRSRRVKDKLKGSNYMKTV